MPTIAVHGMCSYQLACVDGISMVKFKFFLYCVVLCRICFFEVFLVCSQALSLLEIMEHDSSSWDSPICGDVLD